MVKQEDFDRLTDLWGRIDSWVTHPEKRDEITREIWEKWGADKAVMITDLSRFSQLTRRHGIIHFLSIIRLSHSIYLPIVRRFGGALMKIIADDLVVCFDTPRQAIDAAVEMQKANREHNSSVDEKLKIGLCVGIESGRILLFDDVDLYGDPVNISSKLGEDLAGPNEILVGPRAFSTYCKQIPGRKPLFIPERTGIAEVDFDYYRVEWEKL